MFEISPESCKFVAEIPFSYFYFYFFCTTGRLSGENPYGFFLFYEFVWKINKKSSFLCL